MVETFAIAHLFQKSGLYKIPFPQWFENCLGLTIQSTDLWHYKDKRKRSANRDDFERSENIRQHAFKIVDGGEKFGLCSIYKMHKVCYF